MKKINNVRFICFGGMLTAIAVLFQSAPVFLPALGLALSPISTLPIAVAAATNVFLGFSVFLSSAFILAFVSAQEAMILLFTTGLLGIVMGALLYSRGIFISTLFSSIALSLGMIFLTYVIGIPAFKDLSNSLSTPFTVLLFFAFSLSYAIIWNICFRKFEKYMNKVIRN